MKDNPQHPSTRDPPHSIPSTLPTSTRPHSHFEIKRPAQRSTIFDNLDEEDLDRLYNHSKNQTPLPYLFAPPQYEPRFTKTRGTCNRICRKYTKNDFFTRFNPAFRLFVIAFAAVIAVLKLRLNFDNAFSLITTFFSVFQPNLGRTLQSCWYNAIANATCGLVLAFFRYYFEFSRLAIGILFPLSTLVVCLLWGAGVNASQYKSFIGFQGTYFLLIYRSNESYLYVFRLFGISSIGYAVAILVCLLPYPLTASAGLAQICHKILSKMSKLLYLITKAFLTNRHSGVLSKNQHSKAFSDLISSLRSKRHPHAHSSSHHSSHRSHRTKPALLDRDHAISQTPIDRNDISVLNQPHHKNIDSVFASTPSKPPQTSSKPASPTSQQRRVGKISVKAVSAAKNTPVKIKSPKQTKQRVMSPEQLIAAPVDDWLLVTADNTPHQASCEPIPTSTNTSAVIDSPHNTQGLYSGNIIQPNQDQITKMRKAHRIDRLNPIDPSSNSNPGLPAGKSHGNYFLQRQNTFTQKQLQMQLRDGINEVYDESDSDVDDSTRKHGSMKYHNDRHKSHVKDRLLRKKYPTRSVFSSSSKTTTPTYNPAHDQQQYGQNNANNNNLDHIDEVSQNSGSVFRGSSAGSHGSNGSDPLTDDILSESEEGTDTTDEDEDGESGTDDAVEECSSSDESDGMTTIGPNKIELVVHGKSGKQTKAVKKSAQMRHNAHSHVNPHHAEMSQFEHNVGNAFATHLAGGSSTHQSGSLFDQISNNTQSYRQPYYNQSQQLQMDLNDVELQDSIATYSPFPQMYLTECYILIDEIQTAIAQGQALLPDLIVESQLFRIIYSILCCCFRVKHYKDMAFRRAHHMVPEVDPLYPSLGKHKTVTGAPYNPVSALAFFQDASASLSNAKSLLTCLTTMASFSQGGIMLYSLHALYLSNDMKRITKLFKSFIFSAKERNPDLLPLDSSFIKCLGKMKQSGGGLDVFSAMFSVLSKAHGLHGGKLGGKHGKVAVNPNSPPDGYVDIIDTQLPPEHVPQYTTSSIFVRKRFQDRREKQSTREGRSNDNTLSSSCFPNQFLSMQEPTTFYASLHGRPQPHMMNLSQTDSLNATKTARSGHNSFPSRAQQGSSATLQAAPEQTTFDPPVLNNPNSLLRMFSTDAPEGAPDVKKTPEDEEDHLSFFKSKGHGVAQRIDIRAMNKQYDEMQQQKQQQQQQQQSQTANQSTENITMEQMYKRYQMYKKYGKVDESRIRRLSFVPGTYVSLLHAMRNFWVLYSKLRLKCFTGVRKVRPYKFTTSEAVPGGTKYTTHSGLYTEFIPPFFAYAGTKGNSSSDPRGSNSPLQTLDSQYSNDLTSPPLQTHHNWVQSEVQFNAKHYHYADTDTDANNRYFPNMNLTKQSIGPLPPPSQPPSIVLPNQTYKPNSANQSTTIQLPSFDLPDDFGHTLGPGPNFDSLFSSPQPTQQFPQNNSQQLRMANSNPDSHHNSFQSQPYLRNSNFNPAMMTDFTPNSSIPLLARSPNLGEYKGTYPLPPTSSTNTAEPKDPNDPAMQFFSHNHPHFQPQPSQQLHAHFQQPLPSSSSFNSPNPTPTTAFPNHPFTLPPHLKNYSSQVRRQYQITLTDMMTLTTFFFNLDRFISRIAHRLIPHLCPHLYPIMSLVSTLPPSQTLGDDGREVVPPIFRQHQHSTIIPHPHQSPPPSQSHPESPDQPNQPNQTQTHAQFHQQQQQQQQHQQQQQAGKTTSSNSHLSSNTSSTTTAQPIQPVLTSTANLPNGASFTNTSATSTKALSTLFQPPPAQPPSDKRPPSSSNTSVRIEPHNIPPLSPAISDPNSSHSFTTNLILSNPISPHTQLPTSPHHPHVMSPPHPTAIPAAPRSTHSLPVNLEFTAEELEKLLAPVIIDPDLYGSPRHLLPNSPNNAPPHPPASTNSPYTFTPQQSLISPSHQYNHNANTNFNHSASYQPLPYPNAVATTPHHAANNLTFSTPSQQPGQFTDPTQQLAALQPAHLQHSVSLNFASMFLPDPQIDNPLSISTTTTPPFHQNSATPQTRPQHSDQHGTNVNSSNSQRTGSADFLSLFIAPQSNAPLSHTQAQPHAPQSLPASLPDQPVAPANNHSAVDALNPALTSPQPSTHIALGSPSSSSIANPTDTSSQTPHNPLPPPPTLPSHTNPFNSNSNRRFPNQHQPNEQGTSTSIELPSLHHLSPDIIPPSLPRDSATGRFQQDSGHFSQIQLPNGYRSCHSHNTNPTNLPPFAPPKAGPEYEYQRSVYLSYNSKNRSPTDIFAPIAPPPLDSATNSNGDSKQQTSTPQTIPYPNVKIYTLSQPPAFFKTPPLIPLSTLYFIFVPRLISDIITAIQTIFFPPNIPSTTPPATNKEDKQCSDQNDPNSSNAGINSFNSGNANTESWTKPSSFMFGFFGMRPSESSLNSPLAPNAEEPSNHNTSSFAGTSGPSLQLPPQPSQPSQQFQPHHHLGSSYQPPQLSLLESEGDDEFEQPPSPQAITKNITYKFNNPSKPDSNPKPADLTVNLPKPQETATSKSPDNKEAEDEVVVAPNAIENVAAIPSFWNRVKSALYTLIVPQQADFMYYRMIIKCIVCVMLAFLIILVPNPFDNLNYVHWSTSVAAMLISESLSTAFTGIVTRVQGTALGAVFGYLVSFFAHEIEPSTSPIHGGVYFTAVSVALWAGVLTFYKLSPTANVSLSSVAISTATTVAVGAIDNADTQGYAIRRIEMTLLGCLSVLITSFFLWPNTSSNRFLKSLENTLKEIRTVFKLHFSLLSLTSKYQWGPSTVVFGPSLFPALLHTNTGKENAKALSSGHSHPGSDPNSGETTPKRADETDDLASPHDSPRDDNGNSPPNRDDKKATKGSPTSPVSPTESGNKYHERTIYDVHHTIGNLKGMDALLHELTTDALVPAHPKTPFHSDQPTLINSASHISTAPGIIANEGALESMLNPPPASSATSTSLNPFSTRSPLRQEFKEAFANVQVPVDKKKFSLVYDLAIRTKLTTLRSSLLSQKTIANEHRGEYDLFGRDTRLFDVQMTIVNAQLDLVRILSRFEECLVLQNWAMSRLPSTAAMINLEDLTHGNQSPQTSSLNLETKCYEYNKTITGGNALQTIVQQQEQYKLQQEQRQHERHYTRRRSISQTRLTTASATAPGLSSHDVKKNSTNSAPPITPTIASTPQTRVEWANTYAGLQIFQSYGTLIHKLLTSLIDVITECSLSSEIDTFLGIPITFRRYNVQVVNTLDVSYGDNLQHLLANVLFNSEKNSIILKDKLKYYRVANVAKVEAQPHGARIGRGSYISLWNFQFGPCFVSETLKDMQHKPKKQTIYATTPTDADVEQPHSRPVPSKSNITRIVENREEVARANYLVDQIEASTNYIETVYPGTFYHARQQLTEAQIDKKEETLTLKQIYATISKIIILYDETCKTRMSLALNGQVAIFPSLFLQIEQSLIFILCSVPNVLLSLTVALNTLRSETHEP